MGCVMCGRDDIHSGKHIIGHPRTKAVDICCLCYVGKFSVCKRCKELHPNAHLEKRLCFTCKHRR
jgi:hypothetical protein